MGNINRTIALILIGIIAFSCLSLPTVKPTNAQSSNKAPAIAWQQQYGSNMAVVSNLIQTNDGGYAFMDEGSYWYGNYVHPAIVYKVDSSGNISWNTTIDNSFIGTAIKQASDSGLEVSGSWVQGAYPTIIKIDSQGNIGSVKNYSSEVDLGVAPSSAGKIRTSDGGFVYWTDGNIGSLTKTDSNNDTQWFMNLTYPTFDAPPSYTYPLTISSVIETSNGSLAVLGVGYNLLDNVLTGKIYLITTEPFLPPPTNLPTLSVVIVSSVAVVIVVLSVVLYSRRHRRIAGLKQ
jgi:hypothetical protein